jgi:hypothetical protein
MKKKSDFVDSGFVKTCNELVLGVAMWVGQHVLTVALQTTAMRQVTRIRYLNSPQKFCFPIYDGLISKEFCNRGRGLSAAI